MDDDLKKDPLMGDSSELDAEVADFGKDVSDNFDEVKSESDPVVDEDAGKVVDMSTTEPGIESVNIEKTAIEEPKEVEPEEEPMSEIGAAMDEMLKEEDGAASGDAEEVKEPTAESEEPKEPEAAEIAGAAEVIEESAKESTDGVENSESEDAKVASGEVAEVAATETVAENVQPEPKKKKSKAGLLVGLLILILIVAGVACAILLMPKDNNKQENKTTPPAKEEEISELRLKDNSLSDFDLKFLKIENEAKNKIYSPLSIKYALAMLQSGAAGESKTQIDDILGDYAPKKYMNSKNLSLANGVFIRDDFKDGVKESYVKDVNEKYAAEVIYDSFKSAAGINGWIKQKTLGQISNMLDDNGVSDKKFFLINSLAIDMNWKNMIQAGTSPTNIGRMFYDVSYPHEKYDVEIEPYQYSEGNKFNGEEKVDVAEIGTSANRYDIISKLGEENIRKTVMDDYNKKKASGEYEDFYFEDFNIDDYVKELGESYKRIDNSTDFYFYDGDGVKVFAKDLKEYDGITLQYVAVMPTETSLTDYIDNTSAEKIKGLIGSLKDASDINNYKDEVITKVHGYVPMFNYNYNLNLKDDLKEIGVKDVFAAETADLSNITDEENMYVMDALHSSKIEFSNEGIKAAATTIIGGGKGDVEKYDYLWDVPVEEIDLTFDKPFLYLIRDKATGEVWFTGTVYNGIKKK